MLSTPELLNQLLIRSANGDQTAFANLYNLTSSKLFAVALRILNRRDWAEDVLQESYENIWKHAADYADNKSAPMTWMTSVVRNRCIDWLRRPRAELPVEDEFMTSLLDDTPGPLEQLMQTHDAEGIARCIQALDPQQRQSIALAFFHGLSHSELALHLNMPLGTVKTWVRRGLDRLRGCLAL